MLAGGPRTSVPGFRVRVAGFRVRGADFRVWGAEFLQVDPEAGTQGPNPGTHSIQMHLDPYSLKEVKRRLNRALTKFNQGQNPFQRTEAENVPG